MDAECTHCDSTGWIDDETACGDPEHCSLMYDPVPYPDVIGQLVQKWLRLYHAIWDWALMQWLTANTWALSTFKVWRLA